MVKINNFFFLFLCLLGITTHAQKVSNVNFRQEQSTIIISYDLETKTPCKISLFVSTDDGKTWQGPLKKVTGDAGAKIATGNHSITWNVLEEFEELRGDKIKFLVRADGGDLETVKIGTQEWTVKNLDVSTYRNGDIIPEVKDPTQWANLTTGAWCYYNNDPKNGKIYGKLYNWYAVNDPRGLAPEGFHIPTRTELFKLKDYLGLYAGTRMKSIGTLEAGTGLWKYSPDEGVTNDSGFTGLPAGYRTSSGSFDYVGKSGCWWLQEEEGIDKAVTYKMEYYSSGALGYIYDKNYGFSVRCLRD